MIPWRVVVFLAPLCPICQDYTLFLNELEQRWREEPVEWLGVFPGKDVSEQQMADFASTYAIQFPLVKDTGWADILDARWTPEVFVLDASNKVQYRGRVNDYYYALGRHRPKPRFHDLRDAVEDLLAGGLPRDSVTTAIGCPIE
jgi:thiol-disulfide isomerase/thioredoxin